MGFAVCQSRRAARGQGRRGRVGLCSRNSLNPIELDADNSPMGGTRRNPRMLCADLLRIRWKDPSGIVRKEFGCLDDISQGGACLKVDEPIAKGTILTILYPKGKYEGRIQYCTSEVTGYYIGVEFLPGYQWSRSQYDPPHLLRFRFCGDWDEDLKGISHRAH